MNCPECDSDRYIAGNVCTYCGFIPQVPAKKDPEPTAHRKWTPPPAYSPTKHAEDCVHQIRAMLTGPRKVRYLTEIGGPDHFAEVDGFGMNVHITRVEREPGSDDE